MNNSQKHKEIVSDSLPDYFLNGCNIIGFDWQCLYGNEQVVNHTLMEVYPGIEKTELFILLRDCMEKREEQSLQKQFTYPDGKKAWFELRMQPVPEGCLIYPVSITNEGTVALIKSELVSTVSHALRTPLGVTKWYLETIKREGYLNKAPQVARNYLDVVYRNNERLLFLVRNLLCISRIDHGEISDVPESVNVIELIENILTDMKVLAARKDITFHLKIKKTNLPSFFIDPIRLQEVIDNLLSNAIKYSKPHGKIDITIERKNESLLVAIKDNGIGISKEEKKDIFNKFFRSKNVTVNHTEGSGLGLYVAKSYVESWGGKISVTSREGKGSTFSFMIPITVKRNPQKEGSA